MLCCTFFWNRSRCGWVRVGQVCRMPGKKHQSVCQTNILLTNTLLTCMLLLLLEKSICAILRDIRPSKPRFFLAQSKSKHLPFCGPHAPGNTYFNVDHLNPHKTQNIMFKNFRTLNLAPNHPSCNSVLSALTPFTHVLGKRRIYSL